MHIFRMTTRSFLLLGAGLFLVGCNPATKGWSSSKGGSVSFGRLVAAKQDCNYSRARHRAINLLDASGNKGRNERRAAVIMNDVEQCMKKYGVKYKRRAYGIGYLKTM